MRYGLPYKGSKNAIAEWIVDALPEGECLVDLFCGGGAVTHCAMIQEKYPRHIMNDIDGRFPVFQGLRIRQIQHTDTSRVDHPG